MRNIVNKTREKYKTIFENTGTATIIVEEDTTISLVNGQFEELSGYSREEIEWKKSWIEFVIEEDLERMKELHYSRRKDPESTLRKYEFRFVNKEGDIRDILIVIDAIPKTKKSVASLLDITERKKMEEKLKESEEKYKYLFDNAQVGLYWSRISDGNFLECNDTFAKLFGYDTREEFLASYNAIEHYIDPNARSGLLEEIRNNKEIRNYEIHVTRKDGTPIWVSISARIFERENRIEGAAIDITERKKAEQRLKENTEFTQNVFTAIQDGLSVLDLDLNILDVNPFMTEKYGPIDQIVNRKCYDVYQKRSSPCPWCPSIKTIETGQLNTSIVPYPTGGNPTGWIELTTYPLKNNDGVVEGVIEYVKDITERKKAEEKILKSEEKFREAYNRAEFYKDIFAHDINNILQSILSGIEVSELILNSPEQLENLKINARIIKEQVIRGAELVSNVRKLSQLEETKQNLKKIEIFSALENVISLVKESNKDKKIAFRIEKSVEGNLLVKANNFFENMLENLLINAIRHNRNLLIDITVKISREQKNGSTYAKMEFLDNGIGVDDTMKERIFKRGYSKEKGVYGMGLGLSLVRGIIETHNGKIWVEDRVKGDRSKGSNFVLLIPEVD